LNPARPNFAGNGLITEQRSLMAQQRGPQNRELLMGHQTAEAFLGFQHCGRNAIRASRQCLTLWQTCRSTANRVLDRVGATELTRKLSRQTHLIAVSISSSPSRIEADTPAAL